MKDIIEASPRWDRRFWNLQVWPQALPRLRTELPAAATPAAVPAPSKVALRA